VESLRQSRTSCSHAQDEIFRGYGNRYWDLPYALGGYWTFERNGKKVDGKKEEWQPDLDAINATLEFVRVTGRLQRQA
jgi:hypothetical protein